MKKYNKSQVPGGIRKFSALHKSKRFRTSILYSSLSGFNSSASQASFSQHKTYENGNYKDIHRLYFAMLIFLLLDSKNSWRFHLTNINSFLLSVMKLPTKIRMCCMENKLMFSMLLQEKNYSRHLNTTAARFGRASAKPLQTYFFANKYN